ncbi:MAG: hypothetical protein QOF32_2458 [Gammaproteobacteria bacterium]|jgi:hypothetical protein|nr:hypothetical protein [Gammaproteobacteria bacterium]
MNAPLYRRPAVVPGPVFAPRAAKTNHVRLLAPDDWPTGRRQLVCHWYQDRNGRLACLWAARITPILPADPANFVQLPVNGIDLCP